MGSCNPLSTPGFGSELLVEQLEETLLNAEDKQGYQAIIGSVMYLAQITRYDSSLGPRRPLRRFT